MNVNLEEELQKFEGEFEREKIWTCESLENKLDFSFSHFFFLIILIIFNFLNYKKNIFFLNFL
jgi:hypothetical protein